MIALLLSISLLFATTTYCDNKELIECHFLDEYTDWLLSSTESLDSDDDTMYIELEEAQFIPVEDTKKEALPSDIKYTCDFTPTAGVNPCLQDILM